MPQRQIPQPQISARSQGIASTHEPSSNSLCLCALWGLLLLLPLLLLVLSPRPVHAQANNYQDFIIGPQAVGLGGAFTAIADDPTASYYNPAGLTQLKGTRLGLSLTAYGLEYRYTRSGLSRGDQQADLDRLGFVSLPTQLGFARPFGKKDKYGRRVWSIAFTILSPWRSNFRFRQGIRDARSSFNALYAVNQSRQTFMAGPSLARRFGRFSVGASLFYAHHSMSSSLTQTGTLRLCQQGRCQPDQSYTLLSTIDGFSGSFNFRFGALYQLNPQWRFGLMTSLSSFRVLGSVDYRLQRIQTSLDKKSLREDFEIQESVALRRPLPWEIRLGAFYAPRPHLQFSLDLTFYPPQSFELLAFENKRVPEMLQHPNRIRRNPIANVNLGSRIYLKPNVPLSFGLYTNLSSADPVKVTPDSNFQSVLNATKDCQFKACLSYQHNIGFTAAIGFVLGRGVVDIGLDVAYGRGYTQRLSFTAQQEFQWVQSEKIVVYLYLSGAVQALNRSVKDIIRNLQKRLKRLQNKDKDEENKEQGDDGTQARPKPAQRPRL